MNILTLALFFLGQFFANWSSFAITSVLSATGQIDPTLVYLESSHVTFARSVAAVQSLFALLLTAILVLLRTRQT